MPIGGIPSRQTLALVFANVGSRSVRRTSENIQASSPMIMPPLALIDARFCRGPQIQPRAAASGQRWRIVSISRRPPQNGNSRMCVFSTSETCLAFFQATVQSPAHPEFDSAPGPDRAWETGFKETGGHQFSVAPSFGKADITTSQAALFVGPCPASKLRLAHSHARPQPADFRNSAMDVRDEPREVAMCSLTAAE
jgi:hypothetical protein